MENILSSMFLISLLHELMLLDWENSLTQNLWNVKHEKVGSVQCEKNCFLNVLMKSFVKSQLMSLNEGSYYWEFEMKLRWLLLLIKLCTSPLSRLEWENNYKLNKAKLSLNNEFKFLKVEGISLTIRSLNLKARKKQLIRGTRNEEKLNKRREKQRSSFWNTKRTIFKSS